jgi:hypothetical protein
LSLISGTRVDQVVRLVLEPRSGMPMLVNKQDRKFFMSPVVGNVLQMVNLPLAS